MGKEIEDKEQYLELLKDIQEVVTAYHGGRNRIRVERLIDRIAQIYTI